MFRYSPRLSLRMALAVALLLPSLAGARAPVVQAQPVSGDVAHLGGPDGAAPPPTHWGPEPMHVTVPTIDGQPVAEEYGAPMPSFDTYGQNQTGRSYKSLTAGMNWRFHIDPKNQGLTDKPAWYAPTYLDSGWETVTLPSNWQSYDQGKYYTYLYFAWYRVHFTAPVAWDGRQFVKLVSLGAGEHAAFWLNGVSLGAHMGGHTAFALDVTKALNYGGDNVLAVQLWVKPWDEHNADVVPPHFQDWWPWGGLYRDLYLEATPKLTVSKVLLDAQNNKLWAAAVIYNTGVSTATTTVTLNPDSHTGAKPVTSPPLVVAPGGVRVASWNIALPLAKPWAPATPVMYTAMAWLSASADTLSATYGMRTIVISGTQILLNGQPLHLKAMAYHEDTATAGNAVTPASITADLTQIQSSGANMIRLSHYSHHPYTYDWADQHGLLLMDETENYWLTPRDMEHEMKVTGLSRALSTEETWAHLDHPSILLWGLMNECTDFSTGAPISHDYARDLYDRIRLLDSHAHRPITDASAAAGVWDFLRKGTAWHDGTWDVVDVLGLNTYFGIFYGKLSDLPAYIAAVHKDYPTKPSIITEVGEWSTGKFSEQSQDAYFKAIWADFTQHPDYIAGVNWWCYANFATSANAVQGGTLKPTIETFGLVKRDRTPKLVWADYGAAHW